MILRNCRWSGGEGDIAIADGKIAGMGKNAAGNARADEVRDMKGALILPGMVNAHGHTPMTLLRGVGGGLPLKRWLEEAIFPIEAKMTPADIEAGMTWGAMEMLAGGTTCVADMYDFPETGGGVLERIGMKANICRVGLSFIEGRIGDCVEFTRKWNAEHGGNVAADICVHSEYLTDERFCRELAAANSDLRRPLHVHVSETRREHEECIARHGKTPIAYLAETGLLDHGAYCAHCVHCTDDDFRIMAEKGATLVHNPSSNMKLGSGFARIPAAAAAGVNVALGTDGCASNDNLDMFEEVHIAALIHKGLAADPTVLPADEVLKIATENGAKALGRTDTGKLQVGMAADLCAVETDRLHLRPMTGAASAVVYSAHASDVVLTMVDGRILYDHGEFTTIDAERAKAQFDAACGRLLG